jgi:hypothetical protein
MERELGISYPTVRNRVESLVRALGLGEGTPEAIPGPGGTARLEGRQAILERLARGEMTAEEAAGAIRALGRIP